MPNIRLVDFGMEYEDLGMGIPMLLIHGFPLNRTLWQPQIDGLANISRILVPDLRGFGLSDPLPGIYTMDLLARDCKDLLDKLGVNGRVVIGGLSMGGYIAFAFFRLFPERVAGLILAATRAGADSPEGKANRQKSAELAREQGAFPVVENMLPKMMAPKTYVTRKDLVEAARDIMESVSVEGIIGAQLGMMERPDATPLLPQIKLPALILHGSDDQLIPVKEAEAMHAAIPGSQLKVLPEAGHLLNLEQPILFNDALRAFLSSF
jgi:3-oxoadipate enol-lactonase